MIEPEVILREIVRFSCNQAPGSWSESKNQLDFGGNPDLIPDLVPDHDLGLSPEIKLMGGRLHSPCPCSY